MKKFMEKYLGKKGQGMVEYALIIAFVVGVAAVAFSGDNSLGKEIEKTFTNATSLMKEQNDKYTPKTGG